MGSRRFRALGCKEITGKDQKETAKQVEGTVRDFKITRKNASDLLLIAKIQHPKRDCNLILYLLGTTVPPDYSNNFREGRDSCRQPPRLRGVATGIPKTILLLSVFCVAEPNKILS